jgi:hypothetical protein
VAAGEGPSCRRARLRFATDRLTLLRRSRECLLSGGPPLADERR